MDGSNVYVVFISSKKGWFEKDSHLKKKPITEHIMDRQSEFKKVDLRKETK